MEFWQTFALLLVTSILSPWIVAHQLNKNRATMQAADWERQDAVIKAAADANKLLSEGQAKAAVLLVENNRKVEESADAIKNQLKVVHTLVNSNLTVEKQKALLFATSLLVALRQLADPARQTREPSEESLVAIKALEKNIAEMHVELADRASAQTEANQGS